jgi:biotin transport system substrate-specific component
VLSRRGRVGVSCYQPPAMTSETFDKPAAPLARLLANRPRILRVGVVLLGSWLLAAASWAQIPMVPVPMTLQTYALFTIAGLAGGRLALEIVIVWLAQAAIGLPVLAGGAGGLESLTGPTAGFLAGMLVAAPLVGRFAETRRGWPALLLACLAGHALVLALGWAGLVLGGLGPIAAFAGGVLPFLIGAAVKSLAAALTVTLAQARLKAI